MDLGLLDSALDSGRTPKHIENHNHRVALRGPPDRNRGDVSGSPSSIAGLARLANLHSFVDWFCHLVQNSPMI